MGRYNVTQQKKKLLKGNKLNSDAASKAAHVCITKRYLVHIYIHVEFKFEKYGTLHFFL